MTIRQKLYIVAMLPIVLAALLCFVTLVAWRSMTHHTEQQHHTDMIVQTVSAAATGRTDVTFTCPQGSTGAAMKALDAKRDEIGFEDLLVDDQIAKVSLVGAGMRSHPGVSATFFDALAASSINVEMISTSEIRISVVTRVDDAQRAVQALHTAFGLDADGEAVVYAGTGR